MDIILLILASLLGLTFLTALIGIVYPFDSLKFKGRKDAAQTAAGSLVFLISVLTIYVIFYNGEEKTQSSIQTAGKSQENIVEDDVVEVEPSNSKFRRVDAVNAISDEPKVVEAIFPNNSSNSLWVSMFDDGPRRDGYAQYVCQILRDHGMPSNKLVVIRIWDATEMARENFKELGKHECLFR